MSTLLQNLQQKSEQEKIAFAMIGALSVIVLLFSMWGYNFAQSGKVQNLASSAVSIGGQVRDSDVADDFAIMIEQIKSIDLEADAESADPKSGVNTQDQSVGAKHINVFTAPKYGENTADVLY